MTMTMLESAAQHMAAGVEDLDELAKLVEQDTGKVPGSQVLSSYRSRSRTYGPGWVDVMRKQTSERSRLRRAKNPEKHREASRRCKAEKEDEYREKNRAASLRWQANNRDKAREKNRRWQANNPAKKLFNQCQQCARKRGQECTITVEMIDAMLAPMACSVTGLPLTWERGSARTNPWSPSIDRLDNERGYMPGNVRVVCWAFNLARGEFPDEVVMTMAKALAARAP